MLFRSSIPRQAFDYALDNGTVLMSPATLSEVETVIRRPRFDKYVAEAERIGFLAFLTQHITLLNPVECIDVCRDPKDNQFLDIAVCGQASYIISGDEDLLTLHPFRGISIIQPKDFLLTHS